MLTKQYQSLFIKQYQKINDNKTQNIQNHIKQIQNKLQRQKYIIEQDIVNDYCGYYELENEKIYPSYQNLKDGKTVAMWFVQNKLFVPKYWYHKPEIQDNSGNTVALIYASQGCVPPKEWNHDKFKTDQCQETVAKKLAKNQIIPTQDWMITEQENQKLFSNINFILFLNGLPMPLHVKADELSIFDQARYRIVPQLENHKPDEQDKNGFTVAMILAFNNIKIPEE